MPGLNEKSQVENQRRTLVGKCPVRLVALRSRELREVGSAAVPRRLEGCIGSHRRWEAGRLWPDLRRIEGWLRRAVDGGRRGGDRGRGELVRVKDVLGSRVPRGRERLESAILGVLEKRILRHWLFHQGRVGRRDGLSGGAGEPGLALHSLDQLRERDPGLRVEIEDPPQEVIALIGDGQNGLEEVGVLAEGLVRGVLKRCALPGVAAACQVDKNHAQGPHVVGC